MKKHLIILLVVLGNFTMSAQVGINNTSPDPSSALDITSTESGILIPRMKKAERNAISNPATGLMIFQTDDSPGFYYFEDTWNPFTSDSKWEASGENINNTNSGNVGIGTSTPGAKLHVENIGTPSIILDKNFETGGLSPLTTSGSALWTIQTGNAHGGTKAARSGTMENNQESNLQYDVTIPAGGATLTFYVKVSSEASYDKLIFTVNGTEQDAWSGEVGYTQFTQILTPGNHTLVWKYKKDVSGTSGSDTAYIDDIKITSTSSPAAFKLVDGNQAPGKVLVSDALGNATWQELNNEIIVDIPEIAAFGGMKIPVCSSGYIYQSDWFEIYIRGVNTRVTWMIMERITTSGSTVVIDGNEVLVAPHDAERLQVNYNFDPPLPFEPNGLIFSANNTSSYPDTFSLNYVQKSQTDIKLNITRNDKFGDTSSPCWQGEFYFDIFMTN